MSIGKVTDQCNICGQDVRKLRKQKKMSQDQLAAKLQTEGLGVNQNSISRIEAGKRVVADYELKALAHVLGVAVDDRWVFKQKRNTSSVAYLHTYILSACSIRRSWPTL